MPDILKDQTGLVDREEPISLMEPMTISVSSRHREQLTDLAVELAARSSGFRRSLPRGIRSALSDLVRSMNCYYSNLIEDHHTHPVDIERALNGDFSTDPEQRNLQFEAKAHITVQQWIDEGGLGERAVTHDGICEIHRRFGELLPDTLLQAQHPETDRQIPIIPGQLRTHDVKVGQHVAISPGALPRFLERFEQTYRRLGSAETIIASAAAHHRLLWIHPFMDGNGRVTRLMSHAMLMNALNSGGIWSVARGFARDVNQYKQHLAACDLPRRNDLDGRGNLSEESLVAFTQFFLETCLDQLDFLEKLVQPDRFRNRVLIWAEEEIRRDALPKNSGRVLEAILYRGELPKNEIPGLLGVSERHARRIVSKLVQQGVISTKSKRSPLQITFPADLASRWFPGLFPEKA